MVRQAIVLIVSVVVFGIAVPWFKGFAFLDPLLLIGYACIGVLFITPAATRIGAASPSRSVILARMASILGYGFGISVLLLATGIVTVNFRSWQGQMVLPSTRFLLAAVLLGGAACFAVIGAGLALASWAGPERAKGVLRTAFLLLLLALAFGYNHLPMDWRDTVDANLTTAGLTRFAFRAAALLVIAGAGLAAWPLARPIRPIHG